MNHEAIIAWLLEGDVSVQYQVYRDLLGFDRFDLQERIAHEGWGQKFLSARHSDGNWGDRFYQPKWTSTFYTLLDLRNLNLARNNEAVRTTIESVLKSGKSADGGIPLGPSTSQRSDVCANGMFLNYASYFRIPEKELVSVVDSILNEVMPDGGFNCRTTRSGAKHSSLHSTLSVLEGLTEFQKAGYSHKWDIIQNTRESAIEFILIHQLFLSDRTGEIINADFLKFVYPCRWKYDILRALDYFQYAGIAGDKRMKAAMDILQKKRNKDGTWNTAAAHPGQVHFRMEVAGKPGRWNTLRALRVLKQLKQSVLSH